MAKEDEKLKIGTNGRHFLFAECPTMQISIPTTGNDIYSGAMKNYHVTHFSSRSSFCRFCPNIPSCNYTWATLILWGKYTQSFYQTNSGTYMHPVKISNQSQDLTGFLLQATHEVMQLEFGLTRQLFKAPLVLQDVVTDSLMKHIWAAMQQADIHLMMDIPDFPLN